MSDEESGEDETRDLFDMEREVGAHLYGRRMLWQQVPNIVFSTTLAQVEAGTQLVNDNIAEEVATLKAQPGKDMVLGGAGLGATFMRLGLIDEYQLDLLQKSIRTWRS